MEKSQPGKGVGSERVGIQRPIGMIWGGIRVEDSVVKVETETRWSGDENTKEKKTKKDEAGKEGEMGKGEKREERERGKEGKRERIRRRENERVEIKKGQEK